MRRRRARPQAGRSSLFSFLDGMLCTMGALIVVLTAIARGARFSSTAPAPEAAASIEELEAQRASLEWRGNLLATSRDKTRAQLQDRRLELSHIEEHTRRLRAQLAEIETAEKALAGTGGDEGRDALRKEMERLSAKLSRAQEELAKSRAAAQARRPSYAVVPYTGPNGTERRPLYIECRGDRIILQPEGIELTADDFVGPIGPGNPLAAALRAQREYLLRHHNTNLREPGEPYPLLLVRPDGIEAYYAAREAMSSWGSEFGYEFVDQDWKLEFRPPNAALAELTRAAVAEARERQQLLALAAPRWAGQREWYRVTPTRGGVVRDAGPGDDDGNGTYGGRGEPRGEPRGGRAPGGAFAQGGRYGPRGYGAHGGGRGYGRSEWGGAGGGRTGNGSGAANDRGESGVADDPDSLASVYGAAARSGTTITADGGSGSAGSQVDATGAGVGTGQTADRLGAGAGGAAMAGTAGPAIGQFAASSRGNAADQRAAGPGGSGEGQPAAGPGGTSDGQFAAGPGGAADGQLAAGPTGNALRSEDGGAAQGGGARAGSDGGPRGTTAHGDAGDQSAKGAAGAMRGMAAARGSGSANAAGGASAGSQSAAGGAPSASAPSVQFGDPATSAPGSPSTASVSLARSRGKDWSLPEEARHAVPITRPVRVECRADKLLVRSEQNATAKAKEIPLAARTEESVEELVGTVWEQVETWGPAGRGMYWRPTLSVQVAQGGAGRFADLQTLLADSGLDVRLATPPAQAGPSRKPGIR